MAREGVEEEGGAEAVSQVTKTRLMAKPDGMMVLDEHEQGLGAPTTLLADQIPPP